MATTPKVRQLSVPSGTVFVAPHNRVSFTLTNQPVNDAGHKALAALAAKIIDHAATKRGLRRRIGTTFFRFNQFEGVVGLDPAFTADEVAQYAEDLVAILCASANRHQKLAGAVAPALQR